MSSFNDNNNKSQAYLIASDGDNHNEFCHIARSRYAIDRGANILSYMSNLAAKGSLI